MGEMSLVGPRPLPVRDYEGFSEDWHRRRFSVRPGTSGLWQVAGRSNLPFEQWTEVLGSERLVGATLDRLTHRCHILEATGESYRLKDAKRRHRPRAGRNRGSGRKS